MKTIILNSHPIQYFAPLYKYWAENSPDVEIWYCSDESLASNFDPGFNKKIKWDIDLLKGYNYRFLKNYAIRPSIYNGFWGLINIGIFKRLYKEPKSLIIIHGWAYFTHVLTIIFAKLLGHKVALRAESPYKQEQMKPRLLTSLKHLYLRFLFLFIDKFLYIGEENKKFYLSLGQNQKNLIFAPYAVDNAKFQQEATLLSKNQAREKLNISPDNFVVLFCGKYIFKKRPLDLIHAFKLAELDNSKLIMLGEGELRPQMEKTIDAQKMQGKVILTGFVNQSNLYQYYQAADVFVMCSGLGETWGLSVNEAMNFRLPLIISDTTGCATDLVNNNGYIFPLGSIEKLSELLQKIEKDGDEERKSMGDISLKIIDNYSFKTIVENINNCFKTYE